MMFTTNKTGLSSQLLLTLGIVFLISSTAKSSPSDLGDLSFKPLFKAEKCDCLGYSDDIPTFLSDLAGGAIDIFGEGSSEEAAMQQARNMCIDNYRNFASISVSVDTNDVTESGCHIFRTTQNGDWEAL
jgi:hypothetical protein